MMFRRDVGPAPPAGGRPGREATRCRPRHRSQEPVRDARGPATGEPEGRAEAESIVSAAELSAASDPFRGRLLVSMLLDNLWWNGLFDAYPG
jgi:hypothetical protein